MIRNFPSSKYLCSYFESTILLIGACRCLRQVATRELNGSLIPFGRPVEPELQRTRARLAGSGSGQNSPSSSAVVAGAGTRPARPSVPSYSQVIAPS